MSTAKGSRPEHSCDQAVYPKVRPTGTTVKLKKPSTRGSGLKKKT